MNRLKQTALCVLSAMVLNTSLWCMEESNIHSEKSENCNKKIPSPALQFINKLMFLKRLATGSLPSGSSLGTGLTDITKYIGTLLCFLEDKEAKKAKEIEMEIAKEMIQDLNNPKNVLIQLLAQDEQQIQCSSGNLLYIEYLEELMESLEKKEENLSTILLDPLTPQDLILSLSKQQKEVRKEKATVQRKQEAYVLNLL